MAVAARDVALVTGASSGIGFELARLCAQSGMTVVMVADEPAIGDRARELAAQGADVIPVEADLASRAGVDEALRRAPGPIRFLCANAGTGVGGAFIDEPFSDVVHVIETNVTGTLYLLHCVGRQMREQREGRILITGSIAGETPAPFIAVYFASKAFIDNFAVAFANEMKDFGVSVTCLMPGLTDTAFFERADLMDTNVGQSEGKADPADVARTGFEAALKGEVRVIHGLTNTVLVAASNFVPPTFAASTQRKITEPGSGEH